MNMTMMAIVTPATIVIMRPVLKFELEESLVTTPPVLSVYSSSVSVVLVEFVLLFPVLPPVLFVPLVLLVVLVEFVEFVELVELVLLSVPGK